MIARNDPIVLNTELVFVTRELAYTNPLVLKPSVIPTKWVRGMERYVCRYHLSTPITFLNPKRLKY